MGGVHAQRSDTLNYFVVFWAGEMSMKIFLMNLRKLPESVNSECMDRGILPWHLCDLAECHACSDTVIHLLVSTI